MSDAGEYQGSQAFAQAGADETSVNQNTGSLNYSTTIIDLKGVVKSVGLLLRLSYSFGLSGSFGLPVNWTWNTSFLIPNKSLTHQGKTYVVDFKWSDNKGYQSGLRYVNNHGLKLEFVNPSRPLPSGHPGSYAWTFKQTDGAVDYYDGTGKLLEHADLFGNSIHYTYTDSLAGPLTAKISSITDSWGQTVHFAYQPNLGVRIEAPDGSVTWVYTSGQGVSRVVNTLSQTTSYTYQALNTKTVLSSITHPSGLQSRISYLKMYYYDTDGQQDFFPGVQDLFQISSDGLKLAHSNYQYGMASSGGTYTGFNAGPGLRIGGSQDAVMENNPGYKYDVMISHLDNSGKILSSSRVFYNYLHLPEVERHYIIDNSKVPRDAYAAFYTYKIDLDKHARATNYTQPVQVLQKHWVSATSPPGYQPLRTAFMTYDDYGSTTSIQDQAWDPVGNVWAKQKTNTYVYTAASWGGMMLQAENFVDEVTGFQRQISYSLTPDQKSVAGTTVAYQGSSSNGFQPWKTKTFTYDTCGRVTTESVAWSAGASVPQGTIQNYVNSVEYKFNAENGVSTVTTKDPQGNALVSDYLVRLPQGPIIQKTSPMGHQEQFSYDALGRITSHKDALGNITTNSYVVSPSENSATSTSPLGYVKKDAFDQLGRKVSIMDNGDPTQPLSQKPNRVLSQVAYDTMSRVTQRTNELGLVSTVDVYDAFNRALKETDMLGNVTTRSYDDGALTVEELLNGDLRSRVQLDSYSRITTSTSYADSADQSITYCLVNRNTFDGMGHVVKATLARQPLNSSSEVILETKTTLLDPEFLTAKEVVQGLRDQAGNAYDSVSRSFVRDIFGQSYTYTKTVDYANSSSSFTHQGPQLFYDSCKRLVMNCNQLGHKEQYSYDADGEMTSYTSFDGQTIATYRRDALGRLVAACLPGADDTTYAYSSNGRLINTTVGGGKPGSKSITSSYNLDGSMSSVTFPDGRQQTYTLDKFDRVIQSKDAHGVASVIAYNSDGLIASRNGAQDVVSYEYGVVNHRKGVLVQDSVAGQETLIRNVTYNGWGKPSLVSVTDQDSGTRLLDTLYYYNPQGRLTQVEVSSEKFPDLEDINQQRTYVYDGLGQLTQEVIRFTKSGLNKTFDFAYDGNSNVIQSTIDGAITTMTYNALDQRVDSGFAYDANGRLLKDDKGRTYTYSAHDQLIQVSMADGTSSSFQFNPNGSMSSFANAREQVGMYYDGGVVNATLETSSDSSEKQVSYLMQPGKRVSSFSQTPEEARYFLESQGSTALLLGTGGVTTTSYQAYGSSSSAGTVPQQPDSFGYRNEFTDNSSGAVYLRSRFYMPSNFSFLTMDPTPKENRYAFCAGDPINLFDGTGHSETWAFIAGAVVATVVTVVSGGTLGAVAEPIFGSECLAASMAVGAAAGALGSLAGDGTRAAIQHEHFSPEQAGVDILSGAIGGAVGAGSGGLSGRKAMRMALARELEQQTITRIGMATSGVIGGTTGSLATDVSASMATDQPLSGSRTALDVLSGALAGIGGAMLTNGAYKGVINRNFIPVPLDESDLHLIMMAIQPEDAPTTNRLIVMDTQANANYWHKQFGDNPNSALKVNGVTMDTIAAHGAGGTMEVSVRYKNILNEPNYRRPISGKLFGRWLADQQLAGNFAARGQDVKLMSCFGGISNAQTIADMTGVRVWASKWLVYPTANADHFSLYT